MLHINNKGGILDSLVNELFEQRINAKQQMKQATGYERDRLDRIQYTCKIGLNTIYGLMTARSSPLFCYPLAASITGMGRRLIHDTNEIVE